GFNILRATFEHSRPLARVLGADGPPGLVVDERVAPIADNAALGYVRGLQLLPHHRLDGVAMERRYSSCADGGWARHGFYGPATPRRLPSPAPPPLLAFPAPRSPCF